MTKGSQGGSRQPELFPRSKRPTVPIEEKHRLVVLTDMLDWDELLGLVESIRAERLKSNAGRPPHLRALVGALLLKATRDMTLREAEDLVRHYAPARYLCGLTETEWSPDHNTLHDFETLLGEDGVRRVNEYVVKVAVTEKLASSQVVVGDTTAQEAAIPYPNEMRLMAAFVNTVAAASRRAGTRLRQFARAATRTFQRARETVREFRLFGKTSEARRRGIARMIQHVRGIQRPLARAFEVASPARLRGHAKFAFARVMKLNDVMSRLLPQIDYWHRTGWVAANKIISLTMDKVYSVVRGKIGKPLEFGLLWGVTRLKGGFVLAHLSADRRELIDARYVVRSVEECKRLFGAAPRAYAYDRAGHSDANIEKLRNLGVKSIGLAPRGRRAWEVGDQMKRRLISERIRVEGSIGTLKSRRYGFTRPRARSEAAMGMCGQRAVLGMNLNKLVTKLAERAAIPLAAS
jgi:hypothetical protein